MAGRLAALLLMLAPAAFAAYLRPDEVTWLVAAGVLAVVGLGADLALIRTWRSERAYAQPISPIREERASEGRGLPALSELSGDLAVIGAEDDSSAVRAAAPTSRRLDLVLTKPGRNRIAVIKEVRALRGCGLREARDIVDGASRAPAVLAVGLPASQARRIHKALTAAGATAELREPAEAIR